jgi:hypothetical protein
MGCIYNFFLLFTQWVQPVANLVWPNSYLCFITLFHDGEYIGLHTCWTTSWNVRSSSCFFLKQCWIILYISAPLFGYLWFLLYLYCTTCILYLVSFQCLTIIPSCFWVIKYINWSIISIKWINCEYWSVKLQESRTCVVWTFNYFIIDTPEIRATREIKSTIPSDITTGARRSAI